MSTKENSKQRLKQGLQLTGNLTDEEIRELVHFEYEKPAVTVREQLRRYYLKTKSIHPKNAEQLRQSTESFGDSLTIEEIRELCNAVYVLHSGFIINHAGTTYTMASNQLYRITADGEFIEVSNLTPFLKV